MSDTSGLYDYPFNLLDREEGRQNVHFQKPLLGAIQGTLIFKITEMYLNMLESF